MKSKCSLLFKTRCRPIIPLCRVIALVILLPAAVCAHNHNIEDEKTIRVGWHEAPFFIIDAEGRRSGYSYEYQQKIGAYTGWKYEYVEGGWSSLLDMLKKGEIDLLANVSYTEERARDFLYTSLPMGTEAYYLFVSPGNSTISSENYKSLNGKIIGVAKNSIQVDLFRKWAKDHNVTPELVEMTSTEEESLHMLGFELDAFVTMDINIAPNIAVPVWKIGSSDYYFAVSSERADLLPLLNTAMSRIQDENIQYSHQLGEKYFKIAKVNQFLNAEEKSWLAEHGKIRVGYLDNYLAFCDKDERTGELTGTLRDYLDYASSAFVNATIEYEAVSYNSISEALKALHRGDIDIMFPANLSISDAESMDLVLSPMLMRTEMDAVVPESAPKDFILKDKVTVAVNRGNTNYEKFLKEYFPNWQTKYYQSTPEGLNAIASGDVDTLIISNYRYSNIARQCEKLNLITVDTGIDLGYYIAVRRGNTELYSILAKMTAIVPESVTHAALTYYSNEDAKTDFTDIIKKNLVSFILGIIIFVMLIMFLLMRNIRAEKKVTDDEQKIKELSAKVFVDALTRVRNKGGYDEYTGRLQSYLRNGEVTELAIGVFDCDNLKKINDQYGHDKGNLYLQASCKLICEVFKHSPVFRTGGDEFVVIFLGSDYENRKELMNQFNESQNLIYTEKKDAWDKVSVSFGVAVYDPLIDRSVNELMRRADTLMYENKRIRKSK